MIAALARWNAWALWVAAAGVLAGWLWVGWQRWRTGRGAARSTLYAMSGATLAFVVLAVLSGAEPALLARVRP